MAGVKRIHDFSWVLYSWPSVRTASCNGFEPPREDFDGSTRVERRFEAESLRLSQASMAELYDKDVRTINEHLINIYKESELDQNATIRKFRIVRLEGTHQISRLIDHYNLEVILTVGSSAVPDYFDEMLERIRDIRASERRVYLRVREIFALTADYQPSLKETTLFFKTIQNKPQLTSNAPKLQVIRGHQ